MSEAQDPAHTGAAMITVEDVRALYGPSTPHFALQLRNRIARLIAPLPPDHPARIEGEREIARLNALGSAGEHRGHRAEPGMQPLPSALADPRLVAAESDPAVAASE
jgi:hypothetical protein